MGIENMATTLLLERAEPNTTLIALPLYRARSNASSMEFTIVIALPFTLGYG